MFPVIVDLKSNMLRYSSLARKALTILMQFSTSFLRELGFSTLHNMKSQKRERLCCIGEEIKVCLSDIRPDIEMVAEKLC